MYSVILICIYYCHHLFVDIEIYVLEIEINMFIFPNDDDWSPPFLLPLPFSFLSPRPATISLLASLLSFLFYILLASSIIESFIVWWLSFNLLQMLISSSFSLNIITIHHDYCFGYVMTIIRKLALLLLTIIIFFSIIITIHTYMITASDSLWQFNYLIFIFIVN